jgi:hypothetical protein
MSEHNERQYHLMLSQLTKFDEGEIALDALVNDLEGLLNALEGISTSWKDAFLHQWGKLEDESAYALFKTFQVLDEETSERIRPTVSRLKLLVLEQIDDPADRRRNGA